MRHLFSTRLRVILIVAVLLAAGLTVLSSATGQSLPDMLVQGALTPLKAAANALPPHQSKVKCSSVPSAAVKAKPASSQ